MHPIPFFSGHALFLSYALLTMRSKLAKVTALVVLLEVAYLKIFVWQDATLLGGIALERVMNFGKVINSGHDQKTLPKR